MQSVRKCNTIELVGDSSWGLVPLDDVGFVPIETCSCIDIAEGLDRQSEEILA